MTAVAACASPRNDYHMMSHQSLPYGGGSQKILDLHVQKDVRQKSCLKKSLSTSSRNLPDVLEKTPLGKVRPDTGLHWHVPRPSFVQSPEEKHTCAHCTLVLQDPIQSFCGHRFCKSCLVEMFREHREPKCPKCGDEQEDGDEDDDNDYQVLSEKTMFPDKAVTREINKLEVKCPQDGCNWTGTYKDYTEHYEKCEFKSEVCPFGCDAKLGKDGLKKHMEENLVQHMESLLKKVSAVTDGGAVNKTQSHQHNDIELEDRIKKIESTISKVTNSLPTESEIGDFQKQGYCISEKFPSFDTEPQTVDSEAMKKLETKCAVTSDIVAVLNRQVETLIINGIEMENRQKLDTVTLDNMQTKMRQMEREMAMKDIALAESGLRLEALELTSYDGVLTWPIKNYSHLKQEAARGGAQSLYSPPFYTSRSGYKLCARLYLNGDGVGKNSHISLFLVLMRGPCDAILEWPFSHKVTFTLLDQNRKEDIVDAFRPDPSSSSFRKPESDMNIASGCPMFAAHAKVEDKRNGYIKDDTLFIRIKVEPFNNAS